MIHKTVSSSCLHSVQNYKDKKLKCQDVVPGPSTYNTSLALKHVETKGKPTKYELEYTQGQHIQIAESTDLSPALILFPILLWSDLVFQISHLQRFSLEITAY